MNYMPIINKLKEVASDIRSPLLLPGLSVGVVTGLMTVVLQVSFASLIFSGPLAVHVSSGIGMLLAGTIVFLLVTTLSSGIRPVIAISQDAPVAIYAGVAAAIAVGSTNPQSTETFITVAAGLILSTLITGVFFFLVGRFGLADLFRFMPYPVIGGFLAGTGWLLIGGGFKVTTDIPFAFSSLPALFTLELLILWLPGLVYALVLFYLLHRYANFLILPGSLVVVVLLYYVILWVAGISVAEARDMGMLYQPFAETALWPAYQAGQFLNVDWILILKQAPALALIPFISILGMLLNTGGIELDSKEEYDMNKELRGNGTANFLGGLLGSAPGYNTLSLSVLGIRSGANTRLVGLTCTLLVIVTLVFGSSILVFFPKSILGGYLMLLGIFFVYDWLVVTARKMPRSDYVLVLLIFLAITAFGYLQGVIFGLLMTMLFFVIRFSRVPLIHDASDLSQQRSSRVRSLPQQILLARHGSRAQVYRLSGYIFFGSATGLINTITDSVIKQKSAAPTIIILDFQRVNGFDISSVNNFIRLVNRFAGQDIQFIYAKTPDGFRELMLQNLDSESAKMVNFFGDLEKTLQWAEDQVVSRESALINAATDAGRSARDDLFESSSDQMLLNLERQARVESLVESCSSYLVEISFNKGALLLGQGELAEGIYLVKSGVVAEQLEETEDSFTLLRELGPGTTFAEPAAYVSTQSAYCYRSKTAVQACILTPKALAAIEKDLPGEALELHRLVIHRFII